MTPGATSNRLPPTEPRAGTSPAHTSSRSWPSTSEPTITARRARSCGAKAYTAPTSSSGSEPAKPGRLPLSHRERGHPDAAQRTSNSSESGGERRRPRASWPRLALLSRSREKHPRSWRSCWPRATNRSSRGDRGYLRAARTGHRHRRRLRCPGPLASDPGPANALSGGEHDSILATLHAPRFVDRAPAQIWATLLDEGTYIGSESTMYRVLSSPDEVRERRAIATHPPRTIPELVAAEPNRVWSYDSTHLRGPARGIWFYLFVMLDIFSRYRSEERRV